MCHNCGCEGCNCSTLAIGGATKLGLDGQNGATWYLGTGAPSTSLGNINDLYLDTNSGIYYQKTGIATWTSKGNLTGPQGPAGANGTNGTNGTNARTTLYNDLAQTNSGSTGGTTTTFETQNIPANTLVNNGDSVCIQVVLMCKSTVFTNQVYSKVLVGSTLASLFTYSSSNTPGVIDICIDRISSTTYLISSKQMGGGGVESGTMFPVIITGADFTLPIAINVQANTNGDVGGITCMKHFAEYKPR